MSERTGIAWTDATFNPWWGCVKVSPGCQHCYAETFSKRTGHEIFGPAKTTGRRTFSDKHWRAPVTWNAAAEVERRQRRVFCASMGDVFEDNAAIAGERERLWKLIRETPNLDWQILTKRPENIVGMLPPDWGDGYPNVWLGTSVEDQQRANERIPQLLDVPATIRFLSCEPLLGTVDLRRVELVPDARDRCGIRFNALTGVHQESGLPRNDRGIDWVIVGGESGRERRPMDLAWLRRIVEDCQDAGVAVFVKQDNAFVPDQRGRIPDDLWVREFPKPAEWEEATA